MARDPGCGTVHTEHTRAHTHTQRQAQGTATSTIHHMQTLALERPHHVDFNIGVVTITCPTAVTTATTVGRVRNMAG